MRHAAQCVGRVLRGKTDWGLMVFADKVRKEGCSLRILFTYDASPDAQRFARQDKRAKLPRWINQYITEAHSNLSTDMAIVLSKLFIRSISQPFDHTQTGISLWTLDDIEAKAAKEKEEADKLMLEVEASMAVGAGAGAGGVKRIEGYGGKDEAEMMDVDEDEYGELNVDEEALIAMEAEMDLS